MKTFGFTLFVLATILLLPCILLRLRRPRHRAAKDGKADLPRPEMQHVSFGVPTAGIEKTTKSEKMKPVPTSSISSTDAKPP